MSNKVIGIISTDWHLKQENIESIKLLIKQKIQLAAKFHCETLICLGDVFDSRISQREEVLNAFGEILDMIKNANLYLWCIPGNHDKTVYSSDSSFLEPFKYHSGLGLINSALYPVRLSANFCAAFIPFYTDDIWIEQLNRLKKDHDLKDAILFSHTALYGSVNNDGSVVKSSITPELLKDFKRVYLGHYHNAQEVAPGIIHVPSIQQNNFGEDPEKGFFLLFDDGEFEFVKSEFKEYHNIKIDIDRTSKADILKVVAEAPKDAYVKVELTGSESKLKSISEDIFKSEGIILKKKRKDLEDTVRLENVNLELSKSGVKELFKQFCEEKGYSFEKGYVYLKNYIEVW